MDQIKKFAAEQQQLADELGRKLKNMKKDSSNRKTERYIEERSSEVENLWTKFLTKHDEIMDLDSKKESSYSKSDILAQTESVCEKARSHLQECREALDETKGKKVLEMKLMEQARRLEILKADLDSALQATAGFGQYLDDIKKQFLIVVDNDVELNKIPVGNRNSKYFTENWFQVIRKKYREATIFLDKKIRDENDGRGIVPINHSSNNLLPKLKIPTFDGKYEEWPTFQDMFTKVIDSNNGISKVEKMQFLKTHVKGDAKDAIQHYEITEDNYESAWNELKVRFDNKRRIVNKLINKILNLPIMKNESTEQLKTMYNTVKECMEALRIQEIDTSTWDAILVCILSNKWDTRTNERFETNITDSFKVQKLDEVLNFILRRFQTMEAAHYTPKDDVSRTNGQHRANCKYCNECHLIYNCAEFKQLSNNERFKFVKERKLCFNCLNHEYGKKCFSDHKCKTCERKHHTLIHTDVKLENKHNFSKINSNNVKEKPRTQEKSVKVTSNVAIHGETALLATALIKVKTTSNRCEYLRALIDPGSQAAFVTEEAAVLLELPREKIYAEVTGLGDIKPKISRHKIKIVCKGRTASSYSLECELLVLPKLTSCTPEHEIPFEETDWHNKILADPNFYKPGPVDIILGTKQYREILLNGIHKTDSGLLGQNTELGWIIFGTSPASPNKEINIRSMITRAQEEDDISKFWELEEVTSNKKMTKQDEECEKFYVDTTRRNDDGTYTVKTPFRSDDVELGESRSRAMARLMQLEKRLLKQENINNDYKEFMRTYIELGHMSIVPKSEEKTGKYYIPHQYVIREDSTTTKLRVVFDASCKTSNGKSLNDMMYIGPRIQQELCDILIRWRSHRVAFTADIEKMYRQIKMSEEDQEYQRILWRFEETQPIREFKLATVTYGTACAPYLAIKTVQQLASDEKEKFPNAAQVAMNNCYVDDVVSGASCEEDAIKLQEELVEMFHAGGFNLRKWCSNSRKVLENVPSEMREKEIVEFKAEEVKKSLGVLWVPFDDTIRFRVEQVQIEKLTKRTILSNVAKIFDPLGLLSPLVVTAKLIVQELWKNNLAWDEIVPKPIAERWNKFYGELKIVEDVVIPRWTHQEFNTSEQEIHGFCDASEKAIGAAVYVKTKGKNGDAKVTLLVAKSKVAPIKTKTTLPKLELCAAVLLAKLIHRVLEAFLNPDLEVHTWTDSMITLSWIIGDASRWKTFVANRVSEIHQLIGKAKWHHVGTKENPADVISRGIDPRKIKDEILWWEGPRWLQFSESEWPKQEKIIPTKIETKKGFHIKTFIKEEALHEKFSSLRKCTRVTAYCLRFINNCKNAVKQPGPLTVKELEQAMECIIKQDQQRSLSEEWHNLKFKSSVPKESKLSNLHPFMDTNEIIRVGGRLRHSLLKYTEKHQIILSGKSKLAEMMVREAHLRTLHGGNQQTLAYIRRKFWIINGKKLVKSVLNKCTSCIRYRAKTAGQLMGQLPARRVTPASTFLNSGVDYAGPILVRTTKGRGYRSYKGYIAIFVCLTTKAIHLEVVSDMTSEMFFAALKRFMARRGTCTNIYSDNGTTFIGTKSMMEQEVIKVLKKSNVPDKLANIGTQWHFIPPSAPHFGGLWEAGVKSVKKHLKRVIGESTLTYEELATLMNEIEACLNSRPLCPLTEDINDATALTPGHFLVGRVLVTPEHAIEVENTMELTERWRLIQKMKKDFWKTWSAEYLQEMQVRNKWKMENENLQIGDIVLIKEDNISPSRWPLARIKAVHADEEGLVRVVTLKKAEGADMKRPIHKLVPLTTKDEENVKKQKEKKETIGKGKSKGARWRILTIAVMFMLQLGKSQAESNFHIEKQRSGLYVEHLGKARIDRGLFRIEVKMNSTKMEGDMRSVNKTIDQLTDFCGKMRELTTDIECKSLTDYLREEQKQIGWMKRGIERIIPNRQKRGILGTLLTSVFGVNDQVYRQIDDLDKNQRELIRASNHQTKFMLQALARFNDTEARVQRKLNEFKQRLSRGWSAVGEMQRWYQSVDRNKLEIHLLSVYEVAKSYLDELIRHYKSILNMATSKENLYEIISPAYIEEIILSASRKLPANIEILSHPIIKTEIVQKDNMKSVFGYFSIAEITEFELIKANPMPVKVENGIYWILEVSTDIIAIDYNSQKYFELRDEELRSCVVIGEHKYICSPSIIRNIDNNENCIIDELYHRTDNVSCPIRQNRVRNVIWKKLYTRNAWIFIAERKTRIAIICSGVREETDLSQAGIIAISQNCVIQTKRSMLTPKRTQTIPVMAGYIRPVAVNLTLSKEIPPASTKRQEAEIEPYDDLEDLMNEEEDIQEELDETHWRKIAHHSALTSGVTILIISTVLIIAIYGFRRFKRWRNQKRQRHTQEDTTEGTEMKPLRKRHDQNDPFRNFDMPDMEKDDN